MAEKTIRDQDAAAAAVNAAQRRMDSACERGVAVVVLETETPFGLRRETRSECGGMVFVEYVAAAEE